MASKADFLALSIENAELRQQLAEVQEQCIELAVDAGELHAVIEDLQRQLTAARAERDAVLAQGMVMMTIPSPSVA